jgi:hydroxyethylthiazole kinase-like sugar kinase family protein
LDLPRPLPLVLDPVGVSEIWVRYSSMNQDQVQTKHSLVVEVSKREI